MAQRKQPPGHRRHRPKSTAQQGLWLYGHHAVAAALRNPVRVVKRLLLTAEAKARLDKEGHDLPGFAEPVDRRDLESVLGPDAVHQGLALRTEPLPGFSMDALADQAGPEDTILVLDQVTDPQNVGAILRSAAVFGVAGLVMTERNATPETGALAKAASGALESVPIARVPNLARALAALEKADFWRIGLDQEAEASLAQAPAGVRTALVLGSEGQGLRPLTRQHCDLMVRIPMPDRSIGSLNVSNAAAIALYALSAGQD